MVTALARNWWLLLIRGVLAVIFGILALVWPGITLAVLVLLFGAYALVDGIFERVKPEKQTTDSDGYNGSMATTAGAPSCLGATGRW
ncbi:MAG: hypothetical protein DCC55_04665 [Chloroflexi bacterium]|nr:MAG: hypothetical protein DCC55_04665 [Chloroflexota bacterium]